MKPKIELLILLVVFGVSVPIAVLLDTNVRELLTVFIPFIGPLVSIQIASLSLVVGLMDKEIVKKVTTQKSLDQLNDLIKEFGKDTKRIFGLGIVVFLLVFILNQDLPEIMILAARTLGIFSLISVLLSVFESVEVIIKIWEIRNVLIKK